MPAISCVPLLTLRCPFLGRFRASPHSPPLRPPLDIDTRRPLPHCRRRLLLPPVAAVRSRPYEVPLRHPLVPGVPRVLPRQEPHAHGNVPPAERPAPPEGRRCVSSCAGRCNTRLGPSTTCPHYLIPTLTLSFDPDLRSHLTLTLTPFSPHSGQRGRQRRRRRMARGQAGATPLCSTPTHYSIAMCRSCSPRRPLFFHLIFLFLPPVWTIL